MYIRRLTKMEEERPNKSLEKVCEALFYKGGKQFKGKIGIRMFGKIVGADQEKVEDYFMDLENLTKNDKDYEENAEREF